MDVKEIELHSEEVRAILGTVPNWIIRWGTSVLLLTTLLFVLITILVRYPDVVRTRIFLTSETLPVSVKSPLEAPIKHLLIKENQYVEPGEALLVMQNAANFDHIHEVAGFFQNFKALLFVQDSISKVIFPKNVNLGEIQGDYAQLVKAYTDYWDFQEQSLFQERAIELSAQIHHYERLVPRLESQRNILSEQKNLSSQKYQADLTFLRDSVIAPLDFNQRKKNYLLDEYNFENIHKELIQTRIQIHEYQKSLLDLQETYSERQSQLSNQLKQAVLSFEARLSFWEERYLLKSPIRGKVAFFRPLSVNQYIRQGEEIMTVVPENKGIWAYAYVSSYNFGKIEEGQAVKIRLDAFPHEEFGLISGEVKSKANIARDGQYAVRVHLGQGLRSSYGKTLDFTQQMQGEAQIITKKLRLIDRIFFQFRQIWSDTF